MRSKGPSVRLDGKPLPSPRAGASDRPAPETATAERPNVPAPSPPPTATQEGKPLAVLLVEDDRSVGETIRHLLQCTGTSADWAEDADRALAMFRARAYDVVISDVRLRGETSGVDVLARIRSLSPDFPFVLMSGYRDLQPVIQALRLDADDFVLKPITRAEDLLLSARRAVLRYRLLQRNRMLEREKADYQVRLQEMSARLLGAEEEERRRIARDLHDSACQSLVMAHMKLSSLDAEALPPDARTQVSEASVILKDSLEELRSLSFSLSPPSLNTLGVDAAAAELVERSARTYGVPITYDGQRDMRRASSEVETFLFRTARELIVNAVKHASPRTVRVRIRQRRGRMLLEVTNDGAPFADPGARKASQGSQRTLGLFTIREHLRRLDGRMRISSDSTRGGACVIVSVPVRESVRPSRETAA